LNDPKQLFAFVSCDGEEGQIRVLTRPDIANRFLQQRIILGKTPRSCSGICQASDISDGFKSEHKKLANASDQECENELLRLALNQIFHQYKIDNGGTTLSAAKISSYTKGLIAMTFVTHNVQTPRVVQGGYIKFGQQGGHVDTMKILKACRSEIAVPQQNIMYSSMGVLSAKVKELGEIPEGFYDDLGVLGAKGAIENAKEAGNSHNYTLYC
jgi:hypothetical protein